MTFLDKVKAVLTKTKVKKIENVRVTRQPAKFASKKRARIVKKTVKRTTLGAHRSLAKRYKSRSNQA